MKVRSWSPAGTMQLQFTVRMRSLGPSCDTLPSVIMSDSLLLEVCEWYEKFVSRVIMRLEGGGGISDRALLVTKTPMPKASFLPAPVSSSTSTISIYRAYCASYACLLSHLDIQHHHCYNSRSTAIQAIGFCRCPSAAARAMTLAFHFQRVETMVQR